MIRRSIGRRMLHIVMNRRKWQTTRSTTRIVIGIGIAKRIPGVALALMCLGAFVLRRRFIGRRFVRGRFDGIFCLHHASSLFHESASLLGLDLTGRVRAFADSCGRIDFVVVSREPFVVPVRIVAECNGLCFIVVITVAE